MAAPKLKKCRGLYTASNRYDVPEGALVTATNILIVKDGVIQPRWGLVASATSMATGNVSHWQKAAELSGTLWYGGRDTSSNVLKIGYASPTSFAGVTALSVSEDGPDGYANFTASTTPYFDMEFVKAGSLLYYNCARGLVRIESSSTQRLAGNYPCAISCIPRSLSTGLARSGSTTVTATTAFAHGYVPGIKVKLTSAGDANFGAGEYTIVTVPSATTFTYVDATSSGTSTLASQTFAAEQFVGSSGFMSTDDRVAYRACVVEYDSSGTEYTGEVSGRVVVSNASPFIGAANAKNVQLAVIFPAATLASNTKIELYRAKPAPSVEPSDEMWLVYSKFLTPLDISRGYIWITDIVPATTGTAGIGKSLYVNESQDGLFDGNNVRPAGAKTAALWKDRMVQANTFDFPQIDFQLLGVDSSNGGLASDDRFCLDFSNASTTTYDAVNSGTALATGLEFTRYSGGTAELDVKHTVLSLIDSINWGATASAIAPLATYWAQYTSLPGDWPGRFNVARVAADQYEASSNTAKARVLSTGNNVGKATAVTRSCWAPKLSQIMLPSTTVRSANVVTVTFFDDHAFEVGEYVIVYSDWANQTQYSLAGTAVEGQITSITHNTIVFSNTGTNGSGAGVACAVKYGPVFVNNHQKHSLRASKPKQLEAFPPRSTVKIGSAGANILKAVPCKDSLMVFKEDGLYRVVATGINGADLSAELVDPNAILWAKDSAVAINGVIMAWLTKGVAIINEQGVQKYVSKGRIDDKLAPTTGATSEPDLLAYPFTRRAQAYVDEKRNFYELRVCFSTIPSAPYASTVNLIYNIDNDTWVEDDLAVVSEVFYLGKRYIQQSTSFYAQNDNVYTGTPTTTISAAGTLNSTTRVLSTTYTGAAPAVGTYIEDDTGNQFYVLSASGGSATLYSAYGLTFDTGSTTAYSPVVSTIKWAPITFGEENKLKRHKEIQVLFGVREVLAAEVTTSSEFTGTYDTVPLNASETVVHKLGSIGTNAGVNGYAPYNLRAVVPQQHRVGQQLSVQLVLRTGGGAWTILGVGCDADVIGPRVNRGRQ